MTEVAEELDHTLPWTLAAMPEAEGVGVADLLPGGYETYLRVLHPFTPEAYGYDGLGAPEERRTWASMGAGAGIAIGPTTTLASMQPAFDADPAGTDPWRLGEGRMDPLTASDLYAALAGSGPGPFRFAFGLPAISSTSDHRPMRYRSPAVDGWRGAVERVRAHGSLNITVPELVWPDDLRWISCTDWDLCSTYVASDRATADRLLAHPDLEVVEVHLRTRVDDHAHEQRTDAGGRPIPDPRSRPGRDAERPLLLLDVDGVLQPTGSSVPPGFQRFEDGRSSVVLCLDHGTWLRELLDDFELVWATTWGATANDAIGRRLGLPELPHIELGELAREGTRKLGAVQAFVGERAVAWVDDEIYEDAQAWKAARSAPTFLRRTAPNVGLTAVDVSMLQAFRRVGC